MDYVCKVLSYSGSLVGALLKRSHDVSQEQANAAILEHGEYLRLYRMGDLAKGYVWSNDRFGFVGTVKRRGHVLRLTLPTADRVLGDNHLVLGIVAMKEATQEWDLGEDWSGTFLEWDPR